MLSDIIKIVNVKKKRKKNLVEIGGMKLKGEGGSEEFPTKNLLMVVLIAFSLQSIDSIFDIYKNYNNSCNVGKIR